MELNKKGETPHPRRPLTGGGLMRATGLKPFDRESDPAQKHKKNLNEK